MLHCMGQQPSTFETTRIEYSMAAIRDESHSVTVITNDGNGPWIQPVDVGLQRVKALTSNSRAKLTSFEFTEP